MILTFLDGALLISAVVASTAVAVRLSNARPAAHRTSELHSITARELGRRTTKDSTASYTDTSCPQDVLSTGVRCSTIYELEKMLGIMRAERLSNSLTTSIAEACSQRAARTRIA